MLGSKREPERVCVCADVCVCAGGREVQSGWWRFGGGGDGRQGEGVIAGDECETDRRSACRSGRWSSGASRRNAAFVLAAAGDAAALSVRPSVRPNTHCRAATLSANFGLSSVIPHPQILPVSRLVVVFDLPGKQMKQREAREYSGASRRKR